MTIYLTGYGCSTAAGYGAKALWRSLTSGLDYRHPTTGVCHWNDAGKFASSRARLAHHLLSAWREAGAPGIWEETRDLGVILSSTKGNHEDFVWAPNEADLLRDPFGPVLDDFLAESGVRPTRKIAVANACASSHAAIFLALHWIRSGRVPHVLVLATDQIGRFVEKGFRALGALSETRVRPFDRKRDGLQLGDGAAALFLSSTISSEIEIVEAGIETVGDSITRPSGGGASLRRACLTALGSGPRPSFVIAHGTGTPYNDAAEAQAFVELFDEAEPPPIMGTKWCIGHTLGASGAIDVIVATEALKRNTLFRLANTDEIDQALPGRFLHAGTANYELVRPLQRALVTSLGFGGVHAALTLARREGPAT